MGKVTLYAIWKYGTPYRVKYYDYWSDSGEVPVDGTEYASGETVTVLGNTGNLERLGYIFCGWATMPVIDTPEYAADQTFTINNNINLYAVWTKQTIHVTYYANGATSGTVPVDSRAYNLGDYFLVAGNSGALKRHGYVFDTWNANSNGTGQDYYPGNSGFTLASYTNLTFYAKWVLATILTLDTNYTSGTISAGRDIVYFTIDVSPGTYQIGWDDSGDGSGTRTVDTYVFAYHEDLASYFEFEDSGYNNPKSVTVPSGESSIIIAVAGRTFTSTGTFGIRVFQ